jgi:hypothetical protein
LLFRHKISKKKFYRLPGVNWVVVALERGVRVYYAPNPRIFDCMRGWSDTPLPFSNVIKLNFCGMKKYRTSNQPAGWQVRNVE